MINIEDYKEVFSRYENANHALEDFADFFVKEEMAGSTVIHRNAAIKRIAAPVIFTALFTGTVIFHLYYHIWPLLIFIEGPGYNYCERGVRNKIFYHREGSTPKDTGSTRSGD